MGKTGAALRDAVFAEHAPGLIAAIAEPLWTNRLQRRGELLPALANLAAAFKKLVVHSRGRRIV